MKTDSVAISISEAKIQSNIKKKRYIPWSLYAMVSIPLLLVLVYHYGPLFGTVIAFQRYDLVQGIFHSKWVGFDNFNYLFHYPNFVKIIGNTLYISIMKIIANFIAPIIVAILLNEMKKGKLSGAIQSAIYLPHFISWVIISGILIDILSPSTGAVNKVLSIFGMKPLYFLGEPSLFPFVLVISDVWKEFGYGTIIYLAALTSIDPQLYEACEIDGANRLRRIWHITMPGLIPIMVLLGTLSLGRVLNAGFDQVFNLYNAQVYETGDIIDTFNYRIGIQSAEYDLATAIGLFKSMISLLLVSSSYYLAHKFADYKIF